MRIAPKVSVLASALLLLSCSQDPEVSPVADIASDVEQVVPSGIETFSVILGDTLVGQMSVAHDDFTTVDYEFRNNGRGPTIVEQIEFDGAGFPERWEISGSTPFGNQVSEQFEFVDGLAIWTDTTGTNQSTLEEAQLYVSQHASPYSLWIYSRLLLADEDNVIPALPTGQLSLELLDTFEVSGNSGPETVSTYALSGIDLNPSYFALDDSQQLFAVMSPSFALVREGYEGEEERLRELSAEYGARRFELIQERVTHVLEKPLRINNVRLFDPANLSLTSHSSVLVENDRIAAVESPVDGPLDGELYVDAAGGTLIAGMYEMHGHIGDGGALLNIAAGVTSIRDMGNTNDVLTELIDKIESGRLVGPRITRSGFIEGQSPYSANTGIVVASEEEAVEAVRQYSNGDFHQIKIYNSMNPEWVPAMVEEARANGLRVAGHVPAFSNADAMLEAGYNELTHVNQLMLGWVLEPDEDTRTLLRFTAMQRFPEISMTDANVRRTLDTMVENNVAIDPTLVIHERGLIGRNGEVYRGLVDVVDNLPIGQNRSAREAFFEVATEEDDEAYRLAYDKIIETLTEMKERGILIVPGTDLGGSFYYHRELELYQELGMTPAEILKLASYDMAEYLGQGDELGSIAPGKLADFFLVSRDPTADLKAIKSISLVSKGGAIYFPSEIYPEFGIQPFSEIPELVGE